MTDSFFNTKKVGLRKKTRPDNQNSGKILAVSKNMKEF